MMKLAPHDHAQALHSAAPAHEPHQAREAAPKADAPHFSAELDAAVQALPKQPSTTAPLAAAAAHARAQQPQAHAQTQQQPHAPQAQAQPQPPAAQPSAAAPQAAGKADGKPGKSALAAAADHFDKIDKSDKAAEDAPAGGKPKKAARVVDTGAAALSLMLRAVPLSPLPKEAGHGAAKSTKAAPVAVQRAKATEARQAAQPESAAKKAELSQAAQAAEQRPAAAAQPLATAPREVAAPKEPAAPAPAAALAAALQARNLDVDPAMNLTLLQNAAHLSIPSGGEEAPLRLHLRVRDGVADVRLDASSAVTFGARADELRSALAGQGLRLGSFEVPSGAQADLSGGDLSQRQRAPEAPPEAPFQPGTPGARAPGPKLSPARASRAGRIDVEA